MNLSEPRKNRYKRHLTLPEVGEAGQAKISEAKVLIVGAGGLGSPAALYLAAAGVGTLGLADRDKVEISNLQRQIIHFTPDLGKPKVLSAKEKIEAVNPDVHVKTYEEDVDESNADRILSDYDFIIDGTDNFPAKFLINDVCVKLGKAYSHAGVLRFDGQTMTYVPGSACYRCVFREMPPIGALPTCAEAGILGVVPGILGTIQATEALKFIVGKGRLLTNRLLIFNAFDMDVRIVNIKKNPECPVCFS